LKTQASQAIESCEIAAKQTPTALRFQYQLARALQSTGKSPMRQKAVGIFSKLVDQGYPAAYDNLGYLLAYDQNNFAAAVKLFRIGAKLGDPDSMLSLAEMLDEGRATPMNRGETKIDLYTRAAQLGHPAAIQALKEGREKAIEAERDRARQDEIIRRGIEFLGGAFGWRR
jgi:TPR repeat protein